MLFIDWLPLDHRTMTRGGVDERRIVHNKWHNKPNEMLPYIPKHLERVAEASSFCFSTTFDSCEVVLTGGVRSFQDVRREAWGRRDCFPTIKGVD